MNNKANPTVIGAFIVGAVILIISSFLVFSSDSFFSKNHRFVVVFNESINGLQVGAPIKLYGVQIGHVTEIYVERDKKNNMTLIPVVFEVDPRKIKDYINTQEKNWDETELNKLIDSGLRMQLQLGSLLTGQLFIEALYLPNTTVKLYGYKAELKEIPSIPSNSDEIQKTLRNVLNNIKTIDLGELFTNLQKIVRNIEQLTGSEETQTTLAALNTSMIDLQQIMSTLKKDAGLISHDLRKTINHADQLILSIDNNTSSLLKESRLAVITGKTALQEINSALSSVKSLININAPISQDLQTALKELARAARSTRTMMDYLERHPDALIYGKDGEGAR